MRVGTQRNSSLQTILHWENEHEIAACAFILYRVDCFEFQRRERCGR